MSGFVTYPGASRARAQAFRPANTLPIATVLCLSLSHTHCVYRGHAHKLWTPGFKSAFGAEDEEEWPSHLRLQELLTHGESHGSVEDTEGCISSATPSAWVSLGLTSPRSLPLGINGSVWSDQSPWPLMLELFQAFWRQGRGGEHFVVDVVVWLVFPAVFSSCVTNAF